VAETRPWVRPAGLIWPSFFEVRFPLAPITHRNRNGNSLKELAQTTIKKRAHAQFFNFLVLHVHESKALVPNLERLET
jgi:hypothetical protein